MDFDKKYLYGRYYDFYKELLTDKQKEYFESYILLDNSFSEVAEAMSVSRNAVYDNISKTIKNLERFESKLMLVSKYDKISDLLEQIRDEDNKKIIDKIIEIL